MQKKKKNVEFQLKNNSKFTIVRNHSIFDSKIDKSVKKTTQKYITICNQKIMLNGKYIYQDYITINNKATNHSIKKVRKMIVLNTNGVVVADVNKKN